MLKLIEAQDFQSLIVFLSCKGTAEDKLTSSEILAQ